MTGPLAKPALSPKPVNWPLIDLASLVNRPPMAKTGPRPAFLGPLGPLDSGTLWTQRPHFDPWSPATLGSTDPKDPWTTRTLGPQGPRDGTQGPRDPRDPWTQGPHGPWDQAPQARTRGPTDPTGPPLDSKGSRQNPESLPDAPARLPSLPLFIRKRAYILYRIKSYATSIPSFDSPSRLSPRSSSLFSVSFSVSDR